MKLHRPSPAAHPADIDVDEIRALIVPNSAPLQRQCRITQVRGLGTRDPNVDCHCLHVQAVLRHGRGTPPQEFVAPRSAVAANHVDFGSRAANRRCEIGQQIEQSRIEGTLVAGAMVTEEVLKVCSCLRNVSVSDAINNVDTFVGMGVVETQPILGSRRHCSDCGRGREGHENEEWEEEVMQTRARCFSSQDQLKG